MPDRNISTNKTEVRDSSPRWPIKSLVHEELSIRDLLNSSPGDLSSLIGPRFELELRYMV